MQHWDQFGPREQKEKIYKHYKPLRLKHFHQISSTISFCSSNCRNRTYNLRMGAAGLKRSSSNRFVFGRKNNWDVDEMDL